MVDDAPDDEDDCLRVIGFSSLPNPQIEARWKIAQARIRDLERTEADWESAAPFAALPEELNEQRDAVLAQPPFFTTFPLDSIEFGLINLDRITLYQTHVNLTYVAQKIEPELAKVTNLQELFEFCLFTDLPPTSVANDEATRSIVITSDSHELHCMQTFLLSPEMTFSEPLKGVVANLVMASVGYPTNALSVFAVENRFILQNGHHRVYALYKSGRRHVPGVILRLPNRAALPPQEVLQQNKHICLDAPRPQLVRDFFDGKLCLMGKITRQRHVVEISVRERFDPPVAKFTFEEDHGQAAG